MDELSNDHCTWTTPHERRMHLSQFHYLPVTPGFFSILIALFVGLLVIMIVLGALRQAAAYSGSATANEPSGMSRTIAGHCTRSP